MHQMAGGQLPQARYAFVDGMVDFEVLTLQIGAALPAVVEPDEEDPDVVGRAFADQEGIARDSTGLVNEGRGGRPVGIVKHGVVQQRQGTFIRALVAHDDASFTNASLNNRGKHSPYPRRCLLGDRPTPRHDDLLTQFYW